MKIAHMSSEYSSNGGVGVYVLRISKALQASGHENVIFHNDLEALNDVPGIKQYFFEKYSHFASRKDSSKIEEVMTKLRLENPDIVHMQSNENYALEKAIRSEFPAIKSIHVYEFCPSGNKFHYATSQVCEHKTGPMCIPRMIYKRCTLSLRPNVIELFYSRSTKSIRNDQCYPKILVASEYVREQALFNGFRADQVETLPYFANKPDLTSNESDENIILFAGRVVPEKGLDRLLDALALIPKSRSWKLVVDGDGSELSKMKKKSAQLGLDSKVEFCGWLNQERHLKFYERAAMAVVPSIWPEPFGLVGIEAMSYAKPVIAFRVGGIPDWLSDGESGYLVKPYDLAHMAQRIDQLLVDAALRKKMGKRARELFESKFMLEQHQQRLEQYYRDVIDSYKRAS